MVVVDNFSIVNGNQILGSDEDLSTVTRGDYKQNTVLKICTLNIQHAGNSRLEQAERCLQQMNIDVAILTETKITKKDSPNSVEWEYDIISTEAKSNSIGGVALCVRQSPWFHTEGTKLHGPNVISTQIVTGRKRWFLIGAYIPPSETDHSTVNHINEAASMAEQQGLQMILIGDFNIDLNLEDNNWDNYNDRQMATWTLATQLKLVDLGKRYKQPKGRGDWTWYQRREGRFISKKLDYALVSETKDFKYHKVKVPRMDTDHRMIVIGLKSDSQVHHKKYSQQRKKLGYITNGNSRNDKLIDELTNERQKNKIQQDHRVKSWISERSWILIDEKAEARRIGNREEIRRLKSLIRQSLRTDEKIRAEKAGDEIERCLAMGNTREAYDIMRKWYKDKVSKPPIPTYVDEEKIRAEYQSLYTRQEPLQSNITLFYNQERVDDTVPTEEEIKIALKGMRCNKSPGCSNITVEDLQGWMEESEKEVDSRKDRWEKVVEIVQSSFTRTKLPEVFGIGILVLIPKSDPNQYRGIALLDVIYKLVSRIVSVRMNNSIIYHDAVHGFRRNRGTMTATAELKLCMRATKFDKEVKPRFIVFLDLKKAYDTLDRTRTMEILKAYGVGPNICHFIEQTWDNDTMIPKQAGCYGTGFTTSRGVRQGDIMSPTIFNIVADAVINYCEITFKSLYPNAKLPKILFYADDGVITGNDATIVQDMLNIYTDAFLRVGLKMNVAKTKAMIMIGRKINEKIVRKEEEIDMTSKQFQAMKIKCERCDSEICRSYLKRHQESTKCIFISKRLQRNRNKSTVQNQNHNNIENNDTRISNTYQISVNGIIETDCPVTSCKFHTTNRYKMRQHFRDKHVKDIIVIEEDGREPLPRCNKCGIFQKNVGDSHQQTATCKQFSLRLAVKKSHEQNVKMAQETRFTVFNEEIEVVKEFKYLGRIVTDTDEDKATVLHNLNKAARTWGYLNRLLTKEKERSIKVVTSVYRTIIQALLLYGSETWVLSQKTLHKLEVFHRRCARCLTGRIIHQAPSGEWIYPNTEEVLKQAGLESIENYIKVRRKQVAKYLGPESKTITDMENSLDVDINWETVSWWIPTNPDLEQTYLNLTP